MAFTGNRKATTIGSWFWGQFADEGEVNDAETKIWVGANGRKNMRYRLATSPAGNFLEKKRRWAVL